MPDAPNPDQLEAKADRAAAAGDRDGARRLLAAATASAPERLDAWIKLAALHRSAGDLDAALAAVAGALRIDPLVFVALLMKASLFDAKGEADAAGEAYGHALAQAPEPLPPHFATPLERARAIHRAWIEREQARLEIGVASLRPKLGRASKRVDRFLSNMLRETRPWHSEPTHFSYPGLIEREFHDRSDFPWLAELEVATAVIRDEFQALVASDRAELVPYIQYGDDMPVRQWKKLNRNPAWTAIHLLQNGQRIEANAARCPQTIKALLRIPQPDIAGYSPNAMFSLLAPGTHIPSHVGVANTRLVCHLPLIVPESCWFRVGAEQREWVPGEAFVFDDTIEHEARNDSDLLRVVFILDVWHPGLDPIEREAVTAAMTARAGAPEGL